MSGTNCKDLFTEKQIKYVESVDDKNLRADLLHQIRLRDNMEADRDSFEKMYIKVVKDNIEIKKENKILNDKYHQ